MNWNSNGCVFALVGLTALGSLCLALAIGNEPTGGYWGVAVFCATWIYLVTHKIPPREEELMINLGKLKFTVSKTADGSADYIQIMSEDMFSLNIVLIGSEIVIRDERHPVQQQEDKPKRNKR